MPISSIRIQNKDGETLATADVRLIIRSQDDPDGGVGMRMHNLDSSAELYMTPRQLLFEAARDALDDYTYISSINKISPDTDNEFWLSTDKCGALSLSDGSPERTYIRKYDKAGTIYEMWNVEMGAGGLLLTDLCPACSACDEIALIKSRVEWLRMFFNLLKDVNLYGDPACLYRLQYMLSKRIEVPAGCTIDLDMAHYTKTPELFGTALFAQYATMVHMWNYVVSQNNSSTEIFNAPEDSSGFVIQSKRALPSCDRNGIIKCVIVVELVSGPLNDISVLVLKPATEFTPFEDSGYAQACVDQVSVAHVSAVRKVITTGFPAAEAAGTYIVRCKILPFMYVELELSDGSTLSFDGFSWDTVIEERTGEPGIGGDDAPVFKELKLGATYRRQQLVQPIEGQYNDSKTYPSYCARAQLRWNISVKWTITDLYDGVDKDWEENYVYETNDVRVPLEGILRDTEWLKLEVPGDS